MNDEIKELDTVLMKSNQKIGTVVDIDSYRKYTVEYVDDSLPTSDDKKHVLYNCDLEELMLVHHGGQEYYESGDAFAIVKKYIDKNDYGELLRIGAPKDEYDSESLEIVKRIRTDSSAKEIAEVIAGVFKMMMTGGVPGADIDDSATFMGAAEEIRRELNNI